MLKKTITYTDLNGEERSEDFFFQLRKSEMMELEASKRYGLSAAIEKAAKKAEGKDVVEAAKKIILTAYGEPSPDGKRFIKNDELRTEFYQSPAYDELFVELVTNAEALAEFIREVFPKSSPSPVVESVTNAQA